MNKFPTGVGKALDYPARMWRFFKKNRSNFIAVIIISYLVVADYSERHFTFGGLAITHQVVCNPAVTLKCDRYHEVLPWKVIFENMKVKFQAINPLNK